MSAAASLPMATRDIRHTVIRAALKDAFPTVRFSVAGSRGTAYGWSRVGWTDGPPEPAVRSLLDGFFGSRFNGMHDGYDATGATFKYQGVTYRAGGDGYNTERRLSVSFVRRLIAIIGAKYRLPETEWPTVLEDGRYWHLDYPEGRNDMTPMLQGGCYGEGWARFIYQAAAEVTA